ncbi:MAG: Asp-tRNA(Asn)/Glu-tRNA(Gln) amidotransferase subunit GatC [Halobaculum sp.]|jgi:aspartyl-tRNA(Asn)/glutamyl-tRNA(Gln) amidotransferase subunit C
MSESPERVTTEDVEHVASLARVDLDESEAEAFPDQFADILDYFAALDEVPETESEPELVNVMRADETREGLTQEAALSNAPESEAGYFVGPRVS